MLTISKPLSAGQARRYHAEEFQNARENYYTEADQIRGIWYGHLAARWGLVGDVREEAEPLTERPFSAPWTCGRRKRRSSPR